MIGRADLQRIIGNRGAAVRRWAQPNDLRAQPDQAVIAIAGEMMKAGGDHRADVRQKVLRRNKGSGIRDQKSGIRDQGSEFLFLMPDA
jgi:hypothetical protein